MTDQQLTLASEFPPATLEAWRELAEAALKGAPFEKKLVTAMADGFKVRPLYTREDLEGNAGAIHDAVIAASNRNAPTTDDRQGWDIRQQHAHPDPDHTREAILEDLESGASSIHIILDGAARSGNGAEHDSAGMDGVMLYNLADARRALEGVYFSLAPVSIDGGAATIPAAAILAACAGDDAAGAKLAFNFDPLGVLARTGNLPMGADNALAQLGTFAAEVAETCPQATAVTVDSSHWFNAGATDGVELALALATGAAYLRAMTGAGMSVADAAATMTFSTAVGTDFFTGIAKIRALRLMWRRVLEASGAPDGRVTINAVTAEQVLSKVDPWVNMLRTTVTSFAAGVGGADSVTCLPYDHCLGLPDNFSRRMARNTQLILEEESNIHRVLDPAGGSWYVENLTLELANAAWKRFQAIESEGGVAAKILDGSLAAEVDEMWANRSKRLATRQDPLTGVSEFPNIDEESVDTLQPDLAHLRRKAVEGQARCDETFGTSFPELVAAAQAGAGIDELFAALYSGDSGAVSIPALQPRRLAEDFEALRERAANHEAAHGVRPAIFLANIGAIASHTARAGFARNFFEAGGIRALANDGFADGAAAAAAFGDSGARVAVICGSDAQYAELAQDFARALREKEAAAVYLAGKAGESADAYARAGIDDYVFIGANVLDICGAALDQMGVK